MRILLEETSSLNSDNAMLCHLEGVILYRCQIYTCRYWKNNFQLSYRDISQFWFVTVLSKAQMRSENEVAVAESCLLRSAYAKLLNDENMNNLLRLSETCDHINS